MYYFTIIAHLGSHARQIRSCLEEAPEVRLIIIFIIVFSNYSTFISFVWFCNLNPLNVGFSLVTCNK